LYNIKIAKVNKFARFLCGFHKNFDLAKLDGCDSYSNFELSM